MVVEKYISKELMAFLPVYLDMKGNCTLVYTYEGEKAYIDKSLKTVLNLLAKYFLIDLKETRKYYGSLLNTKNLVPIPFNKDCIFIPLKTRKPICKNDGAIGYININSIDRIEKKNNNTLIYLNKGYEILGLNSINTVNKHIQNGRLVEKLIHNKDYVIKEDYCFYEDYDKPATKGDIALLRKEIMKIRDNLKR